MTIWFRAGVILVILLAGSGEMARSSTALSFDTAESLERWSFSRGPEFPGARGELAWEAEQGHQAAGCLALRFSFEQGGNYVQTSTAVDPSVDPRLVRLWLKKAGGHRVTFRIEDAAGQAFQKGADYVYPDWQCVEVDLTGWEVHWGGPNDGEVRYPIRRFGILIENTGKQKDSTLLVDDVTFLPGDSADEKESRHVLSTYTASDFRTSPHWNVSGGAGNRLSEGRWSYRFAEGGGPRLWTDFSVLGRPQALRFVVDSDGSGHELRVRIANNYQQLEKSLGRLGRRGEQELTADLSSLSEWQHVGGPDHGQIHYPLRMRGLSLHRTGEEAEGRLTLERLEIDTHFDRDRRVLMIPDVRHRGDTVQFSVAIQNVGRERASGELVCTLRSLGTMIRREVRPLTLDGRSGSRTEVFDCAFREFHAVEAEFQWLQAGHRSPPVSITAATVPDAPESAPDSDAADRHGDTVSPMGIGLYLYRWARDPRGPERIAELADLARRAGVAWTREQFDWSLLEPRPGEYDWSFFDTLVDVCRANDIRVLALLCYWAPHSQPNTPEGIDQYCEYVRQVVRRYKNDIRHWQIWNEPNIFFWSGPKEMYADLLTQAYRTIKEEDPTATVLGCSTSMLDREFIKLTMERGGEFDVLAVHPYRGVLHDRTFMEEMREIKAFAGGRPVWITELGFPSQLETGYSERRQASLVARVYLAALAGEAVDAVAWYDFRNDGADPFYHENNFGLIRSDFRPKMGYRSYATMARTVGDGRFVEEIDVGESAWAFRFRRGQRDIVAVCAPEAGRTLTFSSPEAVEFINAVGESIDAERAGRAHTLTLDTGMPVYITGPKNFGFRPEPDAICLHGEPATTRPGGTVRLRIEPAREIREWWLPHGWDDPVRRGDGLYDLTIPPDTPSGRLEAQAITGDDQPIRLPITLEIQSAKIRL